MIDHKCLSCGFSGNVQVIDEREYHGNEGAFYGNMYVACPKCDYTVLVNPFLKPDIILKVKKSGGTK